MSTMVAGMGTGGATGACCVCQSRTEQLRQIEDYEAETPRGDTPLRSKLLALSQHKVLPSGGICAKCVKRATDAWKFQQQLQQAPSEPTLSEKIKLLRHRLLELTQKIDVFVVIGPEKTDGQPVYTEDNIIMVDKNMLAGLEEEDDDMMKNELGERVYQCSVCPESFPKLNEYMEHTRQHPADSIHTCWTCGKQFTCQPTLKKHRAQHLNMDSLTCKLCHKMFQGQVEMRRHSCEARCPACGELHADRTALSEHCRDRHGASAPAAPYVCAICMETFEQSERLLTHVVKHRQTKQFVCGYEGCVLRFATRNALMSHIRKLHAEAAASDQLTLDVPTGAQCQLCDKSFQTIAALNKHMRTHGVRPGGGGARKKVKTELVELEEAMAGAEEALEEGAVVMYAQEDEEGEGEGEAEEEERDELAEVEQHTVLIEQDGDAEASYALEGEEMPVEMLEEEVEYLEVECLEEEPEEDTKPDLGI